MAQAELILRIPYDFMEEGCTLDEYAQSFVDKCREDFPHYPHTQGLTVLEAEADRDILTYHFQYVLRRYQSTKEKQSLLFGLGTVVGTQYACSVTVSREGEYIELVWGLEWGSKGVNLGAPSV